MEISINNHKNQKNMSRTYDCQGKTHQDERTAPFQPIAQDSDHDYKLRGQAPHSITYLGRRIRTCENSCRNVWGYYKEILSKFFSKIS